MNVPRFLPLLPCALALALTTGCATLSAPPAAGAAATAAAGPPTLWQFLGADKLCKKLAKDAKCLLACLGKHHPWMEHGKPLKPLVSPETLKSPVPAVATAAKIKQDKAAAPQKIKALQYLATIGCTNCYPDVEKSFLAALVDCTESVRFAAVLALLETNRNPCKICRRSACCSPKIRRALFKIAYEVDPEACCYVEPSTRVRRVARLALEGCGCAQLPPLPEGPLEGPAPPSELETPPVPSPPPAGVPPAPQPIPAAAFEPVEQASRAGTAVAVSSHKSGDHDAHSLAAKASSVARSAETPSAQEIQAYYQAHREEFRQPRAVRWEQMTAAYSDFSTKKLARAALGYVRQRAAGGNPERPSEVNLSQLRTKANGWTRREAVHSPVIARALFTLPVGQTSIVLTDGSGYHVVRVLAQRGQTIAPLAQVREVIVRRIRNRPSGKLELVQHVEPASSSPRGENLDSTPVFSRSSGLGGRVPSRRGKH